MITPAPAFLYNPSPSAPIGWYRVTAVDDYKVGVLVAAWLPEGAEQVAAERGYLPPHTPVIKTVWAVGGDEYCVTGQTVSFSEQPPLSVKLVDRLGRRMPQMSRGCFLLDRDEVLLISDEIDSSFDSRYFGPVSRNNLIGTANYLGTFDSRYSRKNGQLGWARGRGAEGKIKETGTKGHLEPCLHIDFYGAKELALELCFGGYPIPTTGSDGTMAEIPEFGADYEQ